VVLLGLGGRVAAGPCDGWVVSRRVAHLSRISEPRQPYLHGGFRLRPVLHPHADHGRNSGQRARKPMTFSGPLGLVSRQVPQFAMGVQVGGGSHPRPNACRQWTCCSIRGWPWPSCQAVSVSLKDLPLRRGAILQPGRRAQVNAAVSPGPVVRAVPAATRTVLARFGQDQLRPADAAPGPGFSGSRWCSEASPRSCR
jgi:hypothetical protein